MNTLETLRQVSVLVEQLRLSSSFYHKEDTLRRFPRLKDLLRDVYNPHIRFYVRRRVITESMMRGMPAPSNNPDSLSTVLRSLSSRSVTGQDAIDMVLQFLADYDTYQEEIICILDKDLRAGISIKTLNKVFPGLLQEPPVPLAKPYDPDKHEISERSPRYVSRKMDGVRCRVFIRENGISFFSRNDREIFTLDRIREDLERNWNGPSGMVIDGELCIFEHGVEWFQQVVGEFRKKDHTIEHPRLLAFDMYSLDEMMQGISHESFEDTLNSMSLYIGENMETVSILRQDLITEPSLFGIPAGWEGLILRGTGPTVFKRSDNLLKVKEFYDIDLVVKGVKYNDITMDGSLVNCVSALICEYKDGTVDIGSGMSHFERVAWKQDPSKVVGRIATVKYTRESVDKNGNESLMFPSLKGLKKSF